MPSRLEMKIPPLAFVAGLEKLREERTLGKGARLTTDNGNRKRAVEEYVESQTLNLMINCKGGSGPRSGVFPCNGICPS
jgi:hypothetical protein